MRVNGVMFQYFECFMKSDGSVWRDLKADAAHLREIGVNAVWIPPCCKGTGVFDTGYSVYDVYDLGEFDQKGTVRTKYGTKQELHEAIDALHANGIQVYADIVINHKAGADGTQRFMAVEVDPENRLVDISNAYEIEGWTKFTFPGRNNQYSDFKWSWEHFSGTDYNNENGKKAVYLINGSHADWNIGVDFEKGNYDYLMFADINYDNPQVREETFRWIDWFVHETKVDGFRLDAIKHINDWFIRDFIAHTRELFGQAFYCVGEYWSRDKATLNHYMRNTDYQIDLFDVPLHFNFLQASIEGDRFDLRTIFNLTLVSKYKQIAVTFVDNMDTQPNQSLNSFVQPWFKPLAYALILLRMDGYPVVFFGDYYGIGGENPVPGHREVLDRLMYLREENAYGEQFDYFDHPNVIGWVRAGDSEHPNGCATVLSNGQEGWKTMFVGEMHAGEIWQDALGVVSEAVTIDQACKGVFKVMGGSVSVYTRRP